MTRLRIAGRVGESIVDGPGIRYALFTQGCPRACPGCHNPQTQPLEGGEETTVEAILAEIDANPLLDGVTFSGGEPFLQAAALAELAREIKKRDLNLAAYTGYLWEELIAANDSAWNALLAELDVVVDGPFVQALRSWTLKFAGSTNQRFIDVRRSLREGRVVELESWRN
ncbi:MAG: anaerobic ribonucleoside-triphosphate reductase activating protein [Thermoguttaceae bacterium]|nr:anaerobic ribonucleoside-triphosphate reductase activating protein [Thermoguttaceae bacterium]